MDYQYNNFGFKTNSSNKKREQKPQNEPEESIGYIQEDLEPTQQQIMEQDMINQQPMMQQQMMYQQMPDPNADMYVQPTIHRNNRGGGPLGIILAILLILGLVAFLLDYTGKVDVKGYIVKIVNKVKKDKKDEKKEELTVVNNETEVANLCSNLDDNGNYKKELVDELSSKVQDLPDSATLNEQWEIIKGAKYCEEKICYIYENDDSHVFHEYNCQTSEYRKSTLEEEVLTTQVGMYLDSACENVLEDGSFKDDSNPEGAVCENFICTIKVDNKEYSKNCKE